MKVKVEMTIATSNPRRIEELKELVNKIRCGELQREMEKEYAAAMDKVSKVTATVDVLEE